MDHDELSGGGMLRLTPEHGMLLTIRDTLYEGSWDDFVDDLSAQAEGQPYVFETVPPSAHLRSTITAHLRLIEEMRAWENAHDTVLQPEPETP